MFTNTLIISKIVQSMLLLMAFLVLGVVFASGRGSQAQTLVPLRVPATGRPKGSPTPAFWANRGRWTFGAQLGFALENDIPRNISHIALLIAQPQLGFIVRDFQTSRFSVSRFEILNEGILGNAVHPGGRLMGHALLLRLDGKPYGRAVPFFELGAGILSTTLNTRTPELSGRLQFNPQAGLGIQYFFRPQRSMVFEYRYMHMSNAGIEPPNHGFNASMVTVGFRWLRRPRPMAWRPSPRSRNPFRYLVGRDWQKKTDSCSGAPPCPPVSGHTHTSAPT